MKIRCLGAVRTVTGSCFQLQNPHGGITILDCGLFQGGRQTELRNFNTSLYRPEDVKAIVITHAHMDHSGLVPRLVKAGYRGPVYASAATCDLLGILWQDAANIQRHEAMWKSKKNSRQGGAKVEPLYDLEAVGEAVKLLRPLGLNKITEIAPDVEAELFTAGHILGAASVQFTVKEGEGDFKVLFSGDIGRTNQLLVEDPQIPSKSDMIFMETTYGNRHHKGLENSIEELVEVINLAYSQGGKVLIPSFAVERTQELLVLLAQAWHQGRIPREMPIIIDSPLAIAASEIYLNHPELYDQETRDMIKEGHSPMNMASLKISRTSAESQKINETQNSCIVLAGSGMANAGRILHHFKHNLWRPNCHVIFVGFQAQGTTGRRLVEGAQMVNIFRESIVVKAKVHTIGGFSGHADQSELLQWLRPQIHDNLIVSLIHGEETGTLAFEAKLKEVFPNLKTIVPNWLQTLDSAELGLDLGTALPAPMLPPTPVTEIDSFNKRLERLRERFLQRKKSLAPERLASLENLLVRAEEILLGP
ncbi:MAG: MBL fold metallo-hydrolase [Deltaproteobacteria bacterium]|jgi:metallo-beta-lactamase family protein|nr:MBL fold metallo-hydrolase [Deltaproteobacteria bacterium]